MLLIVWKTHFCWTVVVALLVIVSVVTHWLASNKGELVNHLSITSSVASILLAFIAIIVTIIYGIQSNNAMTKTESLAEQTSSYFRETKEHLKVIAESSSTKSAETKEVGNLTPLPKTDEYSLKVKSVLGLSMTYCFAKAFEKDRKPIYCDELARHIIAVTKESTSPELLGSSLYAFAAGYGSFMDGVQNRYDIDKGKRFTKVNSFPLKSEVIVEYIKQTTSPPDQKDLLDKMIEGINNYFENP